MSDYKKEIDKWLDTTGICTSCKEHTSVLQSCCSSPVWVEGGTIDGDAIWQELCECGGNEDCPACLYFQSQV